MLKKRWWSKYTNITFAFNHKILHATLPRIPHFLVNLASYLFFPWSAKGYTDNGNAKPAD